jgi:hypothetical protein
MPTLQPPSVADVERIAANPDAIVRNLQITQCYAELSGIMVQRTGPSANWCTFATWASKQAGQTIRQEDLARRLRQLVAGTPANAPLPPALGAAPIPSSDETPSAPQELAPVAAQMALEETLWQVLDPTAPFDRAAEAVARGNRKVFEEIAREFARFYVLCFADGAYNAAHLEAFCNGLRPGDPPDGQRYLRSAFTHYYAALFEGDPKRKAELLLLANIEIGYHEQTRLQPEIAAALDAPVIDPRELRDRLFNTLSLTGAWASEIQQQFPQWRPSSIDGVLDRFMARVRYLAHVVITEFMMTMGLPEGRYLRLGRDLRADYPPSLVVLANEELLALLAEVDPTTDSIDATGAVDWGRLTDRLHFIVDLFRCYQEWPQLFALPFTAEQVAAIKRSERPTGEL